MYITQIKLDIHNHMLFKKLKFYDDYHKYIEQAYPAELLLNIRKRHLWRLQTANGQPTLLLVSEDEPDKQVLAKYSKSIITKNYQPFLEKLNTKRYYHFSIIANPGIYNKTADKFHISKNSTDDLKWLNLVGQQNGFHILNASINNYQYIHIPAKKFGFRSVTFNGFLQITDLDKFKQALINGLGREKAYGMGLLTVV